MSDHPATWIADCFVELTDPRHDRMRRHALLDLCAIPGCAVICGADTWPTMLDVGPPLQNPISSPIALVVIAANS